MTRTFVALAALLAAASLAVGVGGGLARFGLPTAGAAALAHHGALMVCGFFGGVIALERVAALHTGRAVPLLAAAGALLLLAGAVDAAALAWVVAGIGFVLLYLHAGVHRAWSLHLVVQTLGALCWPLGTFAWWRGDLGAATLAWMAFLLLTIAGERRELARLVPVPRWGQAAFVAAVAALLAATSWRLVDPGHDAPARAAWWIAATALGLWLVRFDLAPRHWNAKGWPGHTARSLSVGYAWLLVAAALQLTPAAAAGTHALLLGFVFAMVFGHAPIMLPALARLRPVFTPWALAPVVLMTVSVALRVAGVWRGEVAWLQAAGVGHVAAIAWFGVVMGRAVHRSRSAGAGRPAGRPQR